MTREANHETNDRASCIEVAVEVPLNGGTFRFTQPVPRYIHGMLKDEDWQAAGVGLREAAEGIVRRLALSGDYFRPEGVNVAKQGIMVAFGELLNNRFRIRQQEAGNSEWAVSADLLGERYA
jgi:hypothetical protein